MWPVGRRGPRDSGDVVLRAVAVVGLLAAAALAVQARQGLDWGELADPVEVAWVRVVAGTVVLLVLAGLTRTLLRRLRRQHRPTRPGADDDGPEGEPFPLLLRILAVVLIAAVIAVLWYVVDAVAGGVGPVAVEPDPADPSTDGESPALDGVSWPTLLAVAAVLAAVAAAGRLDAVRRNRTVTAPPEPAEDAEAAELATAVEAAQAELAAPGTDARSAILAAYAAMATSIEAGLAARGGHPAGQARPSDTPTELLDRAVSSGLVGAGPAATLTGLFREARFSRHPMGEPARRAAEAALVSVRGELTGARRG